MKIRLDRTLQLLVTVICFIILGSHFITNKSVAQTYCGAYPPVRDNDFPTHPDALVANTWIAGTSVVVIIFDSSPAEVTNINAGVQSWNGKTACSSVSFGVATQSTNPVGPPPAGRLWVTRGINTQVFPTANAANVMISANIRLQTPYNSNVPNALRNLIRHETGHTFGLLNSEPQTGSITIMGSPYQEIRPCDTEAIEKIYCPAPSPSPTPEPECYYEQEERVWDPSGYGELDCSLCQDVRDNDCDGFVDLEEFDCMDCTSPVVIDTLGNGFDLTSPEDGVDFDIGGAGRPRRLSWIQGDDAWLALDRNGNGAIDSGKELFGGVTFQYSSAQRNGFLALALYDTSETGGNEDGLIDGRDAIYPTLRLWLDSNRNGASEPSELHTLASKDVAALELDYRVSQRTDGNGNRFRYRAKVKNASGADLGRWAWDVFLATDTQSLSLMDVLLKKTYATRINTLGNRSSCQNRTL